MFKEIWGKKISAMRMITRENWECTTAALQSPYEVSISGFWIREKERERERLQIQSLKVDQ